MNVKILAWGLTAVLRTPSIPRMATDFRANRIVVEVDDALLAALNAAAKARSSNVKKVTRTEVLRELIADHLLDADVRKAGVA